MPDPTYDVFISYSHRDIDWVRDWLLPRLESAGVRVCIDFRDFAIGKPALDNMADAATRSRKTLFVMTPNWTVSEFSQFEALVMQTLDPIGRKGRLLPLMLKDCDLPARLQIFTWADFRDQNNWDNELARVLTTIREQSNQTNASSHERTIAPNLVHPYPLQSNFTGRVHEREQLTTWLGDDPHPICELVAMGGMGKSALAWVWVTHDVIPRPSGERLGEGRESHGNDSPSPLTVAKSATATSPWQGEGVMWWSFYESESSFAKFVDETLKYVAGHDIDATKFPTTYDRVQELRRELQDKRVLLVLDGFERQLRAYARLDAAYQRDDATDPSREARACVEPNAARLLLGIAAGTTCAKVLITSRLTVSDLQDRAGYALAGVLERELKSLARDDAIAFMRAQGVTKGTNAEIANVCDAYGNHPLSLRLLSGLIARDTRTPGDIAAAPRHDVHGDLVQRQHHVLEQSYNALPDKERTLLSRLAAFRSPMTYDALAIFNEFSDEAKFDATLNDLQARGLLQRDKESNRYDLHPIVRRYSYDRLSDKTGVHTRLRDYFANIPVPDADKVQSVADLAPVIELYYHSVKAEHYDEAWQLYHNRLDDLLFDRFGVNQTCIELLRLLVTPDKDYLPRLNKEKDQGRLLCSLANSYHSTGQSRNAVNIYQIARSFAEKGGYPEYQSDVAIALGNIATTQISLDELFAAEQNIGHLLALGRSTKDNFNYGRGCLFIGLLLTYQGMFDKAGPKLTEAFDRFEKHYTMAKCTTWMWSALLALFIHDIRGAFGSVRKATKIAIAEHLERHEIESEWLLCEALIMQGKDMNVAVMHLTSVLTRCRRINLVELEPNILLAWARWHRAKGNAQEAQSFAEEALAIADRCEYRLKQADIHNFLAQLALDAGNREFARKEAEIAKERAWCDGPPYCYKPALDEAERLLKELK